MVEDAGDDMPLPPPARPPSRGLASVATGPASGRNNAIQVDDDGGPTFQAPDEDTIRWFGLPIRTYVQLSAMQPMFTKSCVQRLCVHLHKPAHTHILNAYHSAVMCAHCWEFERVSRMCEKGTTECVCSKSRDSNMLMFNKAHVRHPG